MESFSQFVMELLVVPVRQRPLDRLADAPTLCAGQRTRRPLARSAERIDRLVRRLGGRP